MNKIQSAAAINRERDMTFNTIDADSQALDQSPDRKSCASMYKNNGKTDMMAENSTPKGLISPGFDLIENQMTARASNGDLELETASQKHLKDVNNEYMTIRIECPKNKQADARMPLNTPQTLTDIQTSYES